MFISVNLNITIHLDMVNLFGKMEIILQDILQMVLEKKENYFIQMKKEYLMLFGNIKKKYTKILEEVYFIIQMELKKKEKELLEKINHFGNIFKYIFILYNYFYYKYLINIYK